MRNKILNTPALSEKSSGILLYLFIIITKNGAVSNKAVTYPGLGAIRRASVLAVIRAALKLTMYIPARTARAEKTLAK